MTETQAIESISPDAINMSALGDHGDFPMPYAILRVDLNEAGNAATDSRFIYASPEYCQAVSREAATLIGRSYLQINEVDKDEWLDRCYRSAILGETIRGFGYDPIVREWTTSKLAPSQIEGCCIYVIDRIPIDDQQRRQLMSTADARTSYFISEMLSTLSAEQSYEQAMNGILEMMSDIVQADRLCIFVCGAKMHLAFERCQDGVEPLVGAEYDVPKELLAYWFHTVNKNRVVLVPDIAIVERMSPALYQWCRAYNAENLLAAPFFSDGEIVGFLGAYNYSIDETIDLNRFFDAVSSFIAARIDNRQLIESLSHAGSHDSLTGVLNRRGAKEAMDALLESNPNGNFVLALLDLDDFKRVNDVYGHAAGDEALLALTRTLNDSFPHDAIISRNGGDEFLAMLSGEASLNASALLAQLTERAVSFEHEGTQHRLTISVGYARYPEQASTLHELFTKADIALYAVKLAGKAGFGKYTTEAEASLRPQLGFSAHDLLENVPYSLLVCRADKDDSLLFVSGSAAKSLGYSDRFDIIQSSEDTFASIIAEDDREETIARLRAASEQEHPAPLSLDFSMRCKDGSLLPVHAICRIIDIDEIGKVTYIMLKQGNEHRYDA